MSKRKCDFDDEDDYMCVPGKELEAGKAHYDVDNRIKKHTLDSDEEDDSTLTSKKYDVLSQDDIEGQEEKTTEFDGDIQITPFNMNEEMEEGHFDKDGFYHWDKEEEVRDSWLDNIDWVKVKVNENETIEDKGDVSPDEGNISDEELAENYKKMLSLMQPGENVAQSLRRLGGNKGQSASERWAKKRKNNQAPTKQEYNSANLLLLTELADKILTDAGNMDIYQETYDSIKYKLQALSSKDESPIDMFSDTNNEELSRKKDGQELLWEYKMEDGSISAPLTTLQMSKMYKEDLLRKNTCVRKKGDTSQWYSVSRIDFELYL